MCYLRKFGYFVAKMKSIRFSFDKDKGMFYGPLQLQSQQDEKDAQEKMVGCSFRSLQFTIGSDWWRELPIGTKTRYMREDLFRTKIVNL